MLHSIIWSIFPTLCLYLVYWHWEKLLLIICAIVWEKFGVFVGFYFALRYPLHSSFKAGFVSKLFVLSGLSMKVCILSSNLNMNLTGWSILGKIFILLTFFYIPPLPSGWKVSFCDLFSFVYINDFIFVTRLYIGLFLFGSFSVFFCSPRLGAALFSSELLKNYDFYYLFIGLFFLALWNPNNPYIFLLNLSQISLVICFYILRIVFYIFC